MTRSYLVHRSPCRIGLYPRWLNLVYAKLAGYAWLRCDACGRGHGTHEWVGGGYALSGPIPDDPTRAWHERAVCPWCMAKVLEIRRSGKLPTLDMLRDPKAVGAELANISGQLSEARWDEPLPKAPRLAFGLWHFGAAVCTSGLLWCIFRLVVGPPEIPARLANLGGVVLSLVVLIINLDLIDRHRR